MSSATWWPLAQGGRGAWHGCRTDGFWPDGLDPLSRSRVLSCLSWEFRALLQAAWGFFVIFVVAGHIGRALPLSGPPSGCLSQVGLQVQRLLREYPPVLFRQPPPVLHSPFERSLCMKVRCLVRSIRYGRALQTLAACRRSDTQECLQG